MQKKSETEEVRKELMTYAKNLKRVFGEKEAIRVLASLKSGMKKEYPTLKAVCDALSASKATYSLSEDRLLGQVGWAVKAFFKILGVIYVCAIVYCIGKFIGKFTRKGEINGGSGGSSSSNSSTGGRSVLQEARRTKVE